MMGLPLEDCFYETSRVTTDADGCKHLEQCQCDRSDNTITRIYHKCPIHGEDN